MNCREFENRWNEVLDARSDGSPDLDRRLADHVADCERCQAVAARYRLLRQAVLAWGSPPVPSLAARERLQTLSPAPIRRRPARRWSRLAVPMTCAATLAALISVGLTWWTARPEGNAPGSDLAINPTISPRPIEATIGAATSATIDLALEASAPAARIGRDVLSLDDFHDPTPVAPRSEPDLTSAVAGVSATEMFQTVGDRVKPISGSARHAFSFLLGPPPGPEKQRSDSQGSL